MHYDQSTYQPFEVILCCLTTSNSLIQELKCVHHQFRLTSNSPTYNTLVQFKNKQQNKVVHNQLFWLIAAKLKLQIDFQPISMNKHSFLLFLLHLKCKRVANHFFYFIIQVQMLEYQLKNWAQPSPRLQTSSKNRQLKMLNDEFKRSIYKTQNTILNASQVFNAIDSEILNEKPNPKHTKWTLTTQHLADTGYNIDKKQQIMKGINNWDEQNMEESKTYTYQMVLIQQKRLLKLIQDSYQLFEEKTHSPCIRSPLAKLQEYQDRRQYLPKPKPVVPKSQKLVNYIVYTDRQPSLQAPIKNNNRPQDELNLQTKQQKMFSQTYQQTRNQSAQKEKLYKELSMSYQNFQPMARRTLQTGVNSKIQNRVLTASSTMPRLCYTRNWDQTQHLVQRVEKERKDRQNLIKTGFKVAK